MAIQQAPAADDCPDSVFIEDTVVVCEYLAGARRSVRGKVGPWQMGTS